MRCGSQGEALQIPSKSVGNLEDIHHYFSYYVGFCGKINNKKSYHVNHF